MGAKSNTRNVLVGKSEGKRPLGIHGHSWEDNIKLDIRDVKPGDMDLIALAEDRDQ
jgi:hypothetical protein